MIVVPASVPTMGDYRNLAVWRRAMRLVCQVYSVSRDMPADERFGLTSQMRRAATSIPINLAEGAGRSTDRDFARFVSIARGSLNELICEFHLAHRLGFLSRAAVAPVLSDAREVGRMLAALHRNCQRASPEERPLKSDG